MRHARRKIRRERAHFSPVGGRTDKADVPKRHMLHEVGRMGRNELLAWQRLDMNPEGTSCLRMQMRFRFFKRQDRRAAGIVKLGQKMLDEGLKQKDYGEALDSLAMTGKRKPRPIRFIA